MSCYSTIGTINFSGDLDFIEWGDQEYIICVTRDEVLSKKHKLVVVNSELDVFGNEQACGNIRHNMCVRLLKSIAIYIGCGYSKSHKSLHTGQLLKEA
jgi:hypothetical protein